MALAHIHALDARDVAAPRIVRRLPAVLGGVAAIALAAIPGAFAVLILVRPELFLPR
jgi:hypothetical protein